MNLIHKIKNLKYYCKILDENKDELYEKFNIKIDNIYRMYTVYHIDESEWRTYGGDKPIIHQEKTLHDFLTNKSNSGAMMNGDEYFDRILKQKLSKLDQYLISKGLSEMYGLSSKNKIDKLNVKVVIEYKYLSTLLLANLSLITSITILSSLILGIFLFFILK
jgi:hypothetical protein